MLTRAINSLESAAFSVPRERNGSAHRVGSETSAKNSEEPKFNVVTPELGTTGKEAPPAAEAPPSTESTAVSNQNLEKLAERINRKLDPAINLRFRKDEDTGLDFFQIVDKKSGEVLRQYPPEELLEVVESLQEVSGLIFSDEV